MTEPIRWTNETRRLDELQPWPRNPRQINKDQARRLAQSFDEFGQVETIAIGPGNEVYNGHQRLAVLMDKHGGAYEVEVRVSSRPLTEKEREKLTVFLHRGAAGDWDWDTLANEFEFADLIDWGFDEKELLGAGFEQDEPEGEDPGAQVDGEKTLKLAELLELQKKWCVEVGKIWRSGNHVIGCGDSTNAEYVNRIFETVERPQYMIYDPDWDVGLVIPEYKWTGVIAYCDGYRARDVIEKFGLPTWIFAWDGFTSWYTPNRPLRRAKLAVWFGNIEEFDFNGAHYGDAGDEREVKNSRGAYTFKPDPRGKHLSDVFSLSLPQLHSDGFHPYEKPLDWVRLLVGDCFPGKSVFDPFLGCGNTAIACQRLGKTCVGIDIEPMYIAYLLEQFDQMGLQPELIGVNDGDDL